MPGFDDPTLRAHLEWSATSSRSGCSYQPRRWSIARRFVNRNILPEHKRFTDALTQLEVDGDTVAAPRGPPALPAEVPRLARERPRRRARVARPSPTTSTSRSPSTARRCGPKRCRSGGEWRDRRRHPSKVRRRGRGRRHLTRPPLIVLIVQTAPATDLDAPLEPTTTAAGRPARRRASSGSCARRRSRSACSQRDEPPPRLRPARRVLGLRHLPRRGHDRGRRPPDLRGPPHAPLGRAALHAPDEAAPPGHPRREPQVPEPRLDPPRRAGARRPLRAASAASRRPTTRRQRRAAPRRRSRDDPQTTSTAASSPSSCASSSSSTPRTAASSRPTRSTSSHYSVDRPLRAPARRRRPLPRHDGPALRRLGAAPRPSSASSTTARAHGGLRLPAAPRPPLRPRPLPLPRRPPVADRAPTAASASTRRCVSDGVVFRVLAEPPHPRRRAALLPHPRRRADRLGLRGDDGLRPRGRAAAARSPSSRRSAHGAPTTVDLDALLAPKPAERAEVAEGRGRPRRSTGKAADALKARDDAEDARRRPRQRRSPATPRPTSSRRARWSSSRPTSAADRARTTRRARSPSRSSATTLRADPRAARATAPRPSRSSTSRSATRRWARARSSSRPAASSATRWSRPGTRTAACRAIPPDEDEVLHARRLVAQRCLYGVDKNPLAVDLAKLSLWLATLAKDHPFTFLDHALRHGDSLVGLSRDADRRRSTGSRSAQLARRLRADASRERLDAASPSCAGGSARPATMHRTRAARPARRGRRRAGRRAVRRAISWSRPSSAGEKTDGARAAARAGDE